MYTIIIIIMIIKNVWLTTVMKKQGFGHFPSFLFMFFSTVCFS